MSICHTINGKYSSFEDAYAFYECEREKCQKKERKTINIKENMHNEETDVFI